MVLQCHFPRHCHALALGCHWYTQKKCVTCFLHVVVCLLPGESIFRPKISSAPITSLHSTRGGGGTTKPKYIWGGIMWPAAIEKNVVKMWYYVGKCGNMWYNMWTSSHQISSEYMALDGQFYFLVLFGWMRLILGGSHACYESLVFHGHKQTTTLSVYVKPTLLVPITMVMRNNT